jgi:hypothetical protein
MKKSAYSDVVWGTIFFVFSLFMFWESTHTKSGYGWSQHSNVFWPRIILAVLFLLSIILTLRGINKIISIKKNITLTVKLTPDFEADIIWEKMIVVGVIYFGYILLLPWFGFILTTPFFIILNMKVLGETNFVRIIFVAITTSTVFVLLFGNIIGVDLPRGIYFLKVFSRLIY